MFAGNVVQIGVSITSTAEFSNAACERSFCLTRTGSVLSLSKTCFMFRNVNNVFKMWPHSLAERKQISMLSNSRVSNLFAQMLQPLLWSGLRATNVKISTNGVSSLLSYGAIFIWRIIYICCSRQRVGRPWPKIRGQSRRTIIRLRLDSRRIMVQIPSDAQNFSHCQEICKLNPVSRQLVLMAPSK